MSKAIKVEDKVYDELDYAWEAYHRLPTRDMVAITLLLDIIDSSNPLRGQHMIWISQWLCSSRHCAIAVAWDDREMTAQDAERRGEQVFSSGLINRWCGICGGELHVEHGRTPLQTMAEASPHLKAMEAANLRARSSIGGKF